MKNDQSFLYSLRRQLPAQGRGHAAHPEAALPRCAHPRTVHGWADARDTGATGLVACELSVAVGSRGRGAIGG